MGAHKPAQTCLRKDTSLLLDSHVAVILLMKALTVFAHHRQAQQRRLQSLRLHKYVQLQHQRKAVLAWLAHAIMLENVKERHQLAASNVQPQHRAPWYHTYRCGDDNTFLALTGLTRAAFTMVLKPFSQHYTVKSGPQRSGRPTRFRHKHAVLACLLHMYRTGAGLNSLGSHFGVPTSTMSRNMAKAEASLMLALKEIPEAAVRWPSKDQQLEWAQLVQNKEPMVTGCWGVIDRKNYRVASPTAADKQNAYYNGKHPTTVNCKADTAGVQDGFMLYL